jgi:hypothetical protein
MEESAAFDFMAVKSTTIMLSYMLEKDFRSTSDFSVKKADNCKNFATAGIINYRTHHN